VTTVGGRRGRRPTAAADFLADRCRRQRPRPFRRSSRQRAVGLLRVAGDTERRGGGPPPPSASSGDAAVLSAHAGGRDDSDSAESPSAKVGGRRRISRVAASGVALMGRARVVHPPSLATAMPKTLEKGFSGQRPVEDVPGAASARVSSRWAAVVASARMAAGADRRISKGDLQRHLRLEDVAVVAPAAARSFIGRRHAVRPPGLPPRRSPTRRWRSPSVGGRYGTMGRRPNQPRGRHPSRGANESRRPPCIRPCRSGPHAPPD
jgi:hypothetical protein